MKQLTVLEILNEKRKELDKKYFTKQKTTKRIDSYLKAIENNTVEEYHNRMDKYKEKGTQTQLTLKNIKTHICSECKTAMTMC